MRAPHSITGLEHDVLDLAVDKISAKTKHTETIHQSLHEKDGFVEISKNLTKYICVVAHFFTEFNTV